MKQMNFKYTCLTLALMILSSVNFSCQDEFSFGSVGENIEGISTSVSVKICIPDLDVKSRAIIDEPGADYCQDLWIGIYNVATGKRTTSYYRDVSFRDEEPDITNPIDSITLPTQTGVSYIVAVGNVETNEGMSSRTGTAADVKPLIELLEAADTWDEFCGITVVRDTSDVDLFTYDLLMSGFYCDHSYDATSTTVPTVNITNQAALPGAIYLRRVISYNRFNISAADNITVKLKSWRVYNVPAKSFMFEQTENAATSIDDFGSSSKSGTFFINTDNTSETCFEFYQMENKHTALGYQSLGDDDYVGIRENVTGDNLYADREREYKLDSGLNSGIYKSLVKKSGNLTDAQKLDNAASFVEITADVDYYIKKEDLADPENATPVAADTPGAIHRLGEVTYTIHLGYCEDKNDDGTPTLATARDFNCKRNSKYTYTVKIAGLNKVVVEAKRDGEKQPGVEGTVEDVTDEFVELDAHYCVFNIKLKDSERENLYWRITAPYAGQNYTYNSRDNSDDIQNIDDNVLYTWVKFYPTTDESTLVKFPGYEDDGVTLKSPGLWSLKDLADPDGHKNEYEADADGYKYYTVFIDEYVYHQNPQGGDKETKGGKETLWYAYTSQGDRRVEILSGDIYRSTDDESIYITPLYSFSQRSIQTFYKDVITQSDEKAFGIEHINESYGLNLRWSSSEQSNGQYTGENITADYSSANGRYNTYAYINRKGANGEDGWAMVVDFTKNAHINGYTYSGYAAVQNAVLSHDATDYPVPALVPFSETYVQKSGFPDPTPGDALYNASAACLNRNRDLNGNGVIDADEIRWYLPTYDMYLYLTIGEGALETPLMDFNKYPRTLYASQNTGGDTGGRYNFHYITSNNSVLWAEEGISNSLYWTSIYAGAWQIRCARNLGSVISETPNSSKKEYDDPFSLTFTGTNNVADQSYIVKNLYFDPNCIRPSVSTYLPPHALNSTAGKLPNGFELSKHRMFRLKSDYEEDETGNGGVKNISDGYDIFEFAATTSGLYGYLLPSDGTSPNIRTVTQKIYESALVNSLCKMYSQEEDGSDLGTWRLPNFRELALLYTKGVLSNGKDNAKGVLTSSHDYFSSFPTQTGTYRFYGLTASSPYLNRGLANASLSDGVWPISVRCVRDITE